MSLQSWHPAVLSAMKNLDEQIAYMIASGRVSDENEAIELIIAEEF